MRRQGTSKATQDQALRTNSIIKRVIDKQNVLAMCRGGGGNLMTLLLPLLPPPLLSLLPPLPPLLPLPLLPLLQLLLLLPLLLRLIITITIIIKALFLLIINKITRQLL